MTYSCMFGNSVKLLKGSTQDDVIASFRDVLNNQNVCTMFMYSGKSVVQSSSDSSDYVDYLQPPG